MKKVLLVLLAVALAAVGAGIQYSTTRADLVSQRDAIRAEWAQVDAAIRRRAELAPQWLRLSILGAPEAAGLGEELEAARADLAAATTIDEKIRADQHVARVVAKFQSVAARHPRLDSSDVAARLADAENRIAVERRRYNDLLEHYNAQIQRFPDNIVASLAGFSRDNAYFPTEPRP